MTSDTEKTARLRIGKIRYKNGLVLQSLPMPKGNICSDMFRRHLASISGNDVLAAGLFYMTDEGVFYEAVRDPDTPYSSLVGAARALEDAILKNWDNL